MSYNLRSRETLKRPDNSIFTPQQPRKKPRQPTPHSPARRPTGTEIILNKEVLRPLGLFETLFAAYPIAKAIIKNLPTADLMVLAIINPVLRRSLKSQGAFHIFSNHREIVDLSAPLERHRYWWSTGTYKDFGNKTQLSKMFAEYLNLNVLTLLVLDNSNISFPAIRTLCSSAKKLKVLSLQYCEKIKLADIQLLLECPEDVAVALNGGNTTFIPSVKTLRVGDSFSFLMF